jgi:hypothetical protein
MRVTTSVHVLALAPLVRTGQSPHSGSTVIVRGTQGDGQQFVISSDKTYVSVSGDSESFGMDRPSEFVEFLQEKIQGDFIWFRHDGKSYVIRDQATIKRAVDFFSSVHALEEKQEELGKQQEALGEQQEALGKQQEGIRVEIPDMTEDLRKLEAETLGVYRKRSAICRANLATCNPKRAMLRESLEKNRARSARRKANLANNKVSWDVKKSRSSGMLRDR